MHWLTRISIANRWITIVIAIAVTAGSILATMQLKTELIPDIQLPYVMVVGVAEGYSPEASMENIAIPVEQVIQDNVSELKHIESTSSEGQVWVFATFDYGTDMDAVEGEIEALLRNHEDVQLSSMVESEDLMVARVSMEMIPLVVLSISSDSGMTTDELRRLAEELEAETSDVKGILQPEDETPMLKAVEIMGGDEDVLVVPDVEAMNAAGIPVSLLTLQLGSQDEYQSPEAIGDIVLSASPLVTVGDVAEVVEPIPDSYTNGNASVSIQWRKDADANTVEVANAITAKTGQFEADHADVGVNVDVVFDQSDMIEASVRNLVRDGAIGVLLAGIIVLIFLWAFRASLIITITIPLSVFIGFLCMYAFGVTINMLTLGGMAIAVGRIVDNSIVCLENIYRHLQRGEGFRQACLDGVKEVAMPITSATIATVAIFIPMVVVGGLVGELFQPFAVTVTFALIASLVVALMVVPPLASFIAGGKVRFEHEDNWYTRAYTRALRWALGHRIITLLIAFVLFIASGMILGLIPTSFLPHTGGNMMTAQVSMPYANDIDVADMIGQVEGEIEELGDVVNYFSYTGDPIMGSPVEATMMIEMKGGTDMEGAAEDLQDRCDELELGPSDSIRVYAGFSGDDMFASDRLEVRVIGVEGTEEEILDSVKDVTRTLTAQVQELEDAGDIENLESDLILDQTNAWKEPWVADEDEYEYSDDLKAYARSLGLDDTDGEQMGQLAMQLELEWTNMRFGWPIEPIGQESPTAHVGDVATGISVPGVVKALPDMEDVEDLQIGVQSPTSLGDLATVEARAANYMRAEGGYAGTIIGKITADDVGAVTSDVQAMMDDLELPEDVDEVTQTGVMEQMMEGFSQMSIAVVLAIVIVYLVLLVSFRSWLTPLLIMAGLPLASIGAVVALLVTGYPLGMSAMMGVLMLVGIVLTNAIVLLTFVEDRRKEGYNTHDALMDAGRIRLRPILMTALTTMIALIPLSLGIGEGTLIAAELGVVVIGGLFSSTLLTLLVVPVLYSLTDRIRRKAPIKADSPVETS